MTCDCSKCCQKTYSYEPCKYSKYTCKCEKKACINSGCPELSGLDEDLPKQCYKKECIFKKERQKCTGCCKQCDNCNYGCKYCDCKQCDEYSKRSVLRALCTDDKSCKVPPSKCKKDCEEKYEKCKKFVITVGSKEGHPWSKYMPGDFSLYVNGKNGPLIYLRRGYTYYFFFEQQQSQDDKLDFFLTDSPVGGFQAQKIPGGFDPINKDKNSAVFKVDDYTPKTFFYQSSLSELKGGIVIVQDC